MTGAGVNGESRRSKIGAVAVLALISIVYLGSLIVAGMTGTWQWADWADAVGFSVWVSAFAVVGVIIAFHRTGNPIAWICLGFSAVWAVWIFMDVLLAYEAAHPGSLSRPDLLAALAHPLWVPGVGLIGFLLLLFPNGQLPSPRWRPVAWILAGTMAILTLTGFFLPGTVQDRPYLNPLGIEALAPFSQGAPSLVLVLTLVLCLLASAASVVVRYRRAAGDERLQLKWLMAAGVVSAVAYAFLFVWDEFSIQLVWALIPIAIGFSMHRHHLYDIDRLISRTVAYTLVVGVLTAVFVGVVFVLRQLLPSEGDLAIAGSTLAVAAVFNPVRRWFQDRVDRRFNRSRYDAERVATGFAGGLRDETDPGRIVDGWVGVVSETMQPVTMGVWLREEAAGS